MKNIFVLTVLLFLSTGTIAQFQAGNILITGTLVFTSEQSESTTGSTTIHDPKTTTFEVGPGMEYFFSDKISFGGAIYYGTEKTVDNDPGGGVDEEIYKTHLTTITPFASYYFINDDRFALFCRLGIGFGFGKDIYETKIGGTTTTDEEKLNLFTVGLGPGITVHLSDKFGMTATFGSLSYTSFKSDNGTTVDKSSSYGLQLSPALGFGIYYKLK